MRVRVLRVLRHPPLMMEVRASSKPQLPDRLLVPVYTGIDTNLLGLTAAGGI